MKTAFQIKPLPDGLFTDLFDMSDAALAEKGAIRMIVDQKPGFPCRVSLKDAEIGEEVLLLPFRHHDTHSPYQALGPVFVRKGVASASLAVNEIPEMLNHRLLSLRGYDNAGMLIRADVVQGEGLREALHTFFEDDHVSYIHIHNARPGCYNCVAHRA